MECSQLKTPAWFEQLLDDPKVTDICFNGGQELFIDRGQGLEKVNEIAREHLNESTLKAWVLARISEVGKTWDARHPFIDATLSSGHRLHAIFPPLSNQGLLVSLRKLPQTLSLARGSRWAHSPLYPKLAQAIQKGDSILISGATGSGKTTLASDLLEEIHPSERIIALEDTPELSPNHPHFISLVSRPPNADGFGEVTLRTLLIQTLRMRPDRIVLGECRGAEVIELLLALNTGHRGALATLHANSPREVLKRIELLCTLASSGSLPLSAIRELLALGIQWIVQVKKDGPTRKISEIWKVEGREGDTILMRPVLSC